MSRLGIESSGRLLSTMLDVLTAEMSDTSRFSRGRTYARQGAVSQINIEPEVIRAVVQGSKAQPYNVTVHVKAVAGTVDKRSALVPHKRDVAFDCTCPDWESPCKHAIATMVQFAQRVSAEPELLDAWRGVGVSAERLPVRGHQPSQPAVSAKATISEETKQALAAYLGSMPTATVPQLASAPATYERFDEPWSAMLKDALRTLSPLRRGTR